MLELSLATPNGNKSLTFLLDSGAQCSLLDLQAIRNCGLSFQSTERSLLSLGFNKAVRGYNVDTMLFMPDFSSASVNFFCMPSLNLTLTVYGICDSIAKLRELGVPLSGNVPRYNNDNIKIDGIIGNDILQKFSVFELQNVFNVKMLRVANGFVPIGSIESLLAEIDSEISKSIYSVPALPDSKAKYCIPTRNKFSCLDQLEINDDFNSNSCGSLSDCPSGSNQVSAIFRKRNNKKVKRKAKSLHVPKQYSSCVNFVLEPNKTYFSPLGEIFPDSVVEQGIENMYSLESVGVANETTSLYDEVEITKFKESIIFKDGHYHINIPWHVDLLEKVPSNYELAKVIAKKVSAKNGNLDVKYFDVFMEQKRLGIIEELGEPNDSNSHKWIPHRPIIREDPLVENSKIRPVFNCSLKIGSSPSLNEAAYPGTDLLNDLFSLLLYFRSNKYVLISDIAKAFLKYKIK